MVDKKQGKIGDQEATNRKSKPINSSEALTQIVIDLLQYVGTAVKERIDHLLDQRIYVLSHWKIVNPFANTDIENAGMQTPDQLELFSLIVSPEDGANP